MSSKKFNNNPSLAYITAPEQPATDNKSDKRGKPENRTTDNKIGKGRENGASTTEEIYATGYNRLSRIYKPYGSVYKQNNGQIYVNDTIYIEAHRS